VLRSGNKRRITFIKKDEARALLFVFRTEWRCAVGLTGEGIMWLLGLIAVASTERQGRKTYFSIGGAGSDHSPILGGASPGGGSTQTAAFHSSTPEIMGSLGWERTREPHCTCWRLGGEPSEGFQFSGQPPCLKASRKLYILIESEGHRGTV